MSDTWTSLYYLG